MMKKNIFYVLYTTFNLDVFFRTIIESVFLTTVKGLTPSDIILITFIGIGASICLSPIILIASKKMGNKKSLIIGSFCSVLCVIFYMICNQLIGFIFASIFYNLIALFYQPADIMLKNNLKSLNNEEDFVKWKTYGKLGFSVATLIVSLISGFCFNINHYLPIWLSLTCAILGLIFAFLFQDTNVENSKDLEHLEQEKSSFKNIFCNKIMVLILLMNIFGIGVITFYQARTSLLIQLSCNNFALDLAKISIIISFVDFGSRIIKILSNFILPHTYKRIDDKSMLINYVGIVILVASLLLSIGGILHISVTLSICLITLGFFMLISIRDVYDTLESKIIITKIPERQQKQAVILYGVYKKVGRLITNLLALILLKFFTLNCVYCLLLPLIFIHIFICFKLSKLIKNVRQDF